MRNSFVKKALSGAVVAGLMVSASALPMAAHAQTEDVVAEYRATIDKLQDLKEYNALKQSSIADQQARISTMEGEIQQISDMKAAMPAMIADMITAFENQIASDIPFEPDRRSEALGQLKADYGDLTPPDSDKQSDIAEYERKLVMGYQKAITELQIEVNYGRDIRAYRGDIMVGEEPKEVDFLMIGRVALFYRSEDGMVVGMWDREAGDWKTDLNSTQSAQIQAAIAVAREEIPPDLLLVPLPGPMDANG